MLKRLIISALLPACTLPIAAHAQMVTISAAHLSAGGQAAISNATISFSPVLPNGAPASYRIGNTGGQSTTTPISAQVTNGAFSTTIPDTTQTAPVNLCFAVSVVDNVTGAQMLGPGYSCVQPTSGTNSWCSGGACNFDDYPPNLTPMLTTSPGPVGATGPQGSQGPIGGSLSYPGVVGDQANGLLVTGVIAGSGGSVEIGTGTLAFNRNPDTGVFPNMANGAFQFSNFPALINPLYPAPHLDLSFWPLSNGRITGVQAEVLTIDSSTGLVTIQSLASPAFSAGALSIQNGIANAPGYQVAMTPGCAIAPGAAGNSCTGAVTWPVPTANGYIGHCTLNMAAPDGTIMGPVTAGTSTGIGYVLYALNGTAAGGGTVDCWETHL